MSKKAYEMQIVLKRVYESDESLEELGAAFEADPIGFMMDLMIGHHQGLEIGELDNG